MRDQTKMKDLAKNGQVQPTDAGLGRRDLMKKIGAGAVLTTLAGKGLASAAAQGKQDKQDDSITHVEPAWSYETSSITGTGYKNTANRAYGNGPMDNMTKQFVSWVSSFNESNLNDSIVASCGTLNLDAISSAFSGFEAEPVRIGAKIAKRIHGDDKCTLLGYGITTTPEMATFVNSCMVRHTDFNDIEPPAGSHSSVMLPAIWATAEMLHSSGTEVAVATTIAYEILFSMGQATNSLRKLALDGPYEGMATALAVGKLMKLNEDQLANALSLALVPHLPMFCSHVGALSHWKGCHSGMGVREGMFAALMAREGMTGPAQPFEARGGLWDTVTGPFALKMPTRDDGKMTVEIMGYKRYPCEGGHESYLDQFIPGARAWAKPDEIESIMMEEQFSSQQETGDPPKWDPKNRETADHSTAYVMSVALIDGDIYLDSFKPERLNDPAVHALMEKIQVRANPEFRNPRKRITVRKKNGEVYVKDILEIRGMSHDEIIAKFRRVAKYMAVSDAQQERALSAWLNLRNVKDIGDPLRDLAKFGNPKAL